MKTDKVDEIVKQWHKERPDIDTGPIEVIGRLVRTNHFIFPPLEQVYKEFGLNFGEFDVLATILRSGAPYTLTPGQLLSSVMITSGALTNRLNKLEKGNLINRSPDPKDGRSIQIKITTKGKNLISQVIESHLKIEKQILECLSPQERTDLASLLKKILLTFEPPLPLNQISQNE